MICPSLAGLAKPEAPTCLPLMCGGSEPSIIASRDAERSREPRQGRALVELFAEGLPGRGTLFGA